MDQVVLCVFISEGRLNHRGLLAVLQVLHSADALVKLEACTQLLHILYTQPDAKKEVAKIPGWQDTLSRLLIKTKDGDNNLCIEDTGFFRTKQLQASESSLDSLPNDSTSTTPPFTPNQPPFAMVSNRMGDFADSPATPAATSNGMVVNCDSLSQASSEQIYPSTPLTDRHRVDSSCAFSMQRPTQVMISQWQNNNSDSPSIPRKNDSNWSLPTSVDGDSIATESTLSMDTPSDDLKSPGIKDSGVSLMRPSELDIPGSEKGVAAFDLSPGGALQKEKNEQTLVDTLIEILVQIMWVGVDNSSEDGWIVRLNLSFIFMYILMVLLL